MRLVTKVILPATLISTWILLSVLASKTAAGLDYFRFWIIAGAPFGIRRMCIWLIPWNAGIAGGVGVLALNCIVGGLIGGVVLIVRIIMIGVEVMRMVAETIIPA